MSSDYLTGNDRCPKCSGHHPSGFDCMPKDVFGVKRMSSDLVQRLRDGKYQHSVMAGPTMEEAASRIEALEAEVAALRHDIARHMEIANAAQARAGRLLEILNEISGYADDRPGSWAAMVARKALEDDKQ